MHTHSRTQHCRKTAPRGAGTPAPEDRDTDTGRPGHRHRKTGTPTPEDRDTDTGRPGHRHRHRKTAPQAPKDTAEDSSEGWTRLRLGAVEGKQ